MMVTSTTYTMVICIIFTTAMLTSTQSLNQVVTRQRAHLIMPAQVMSRLTGMVLIVDMLPSRTGIMRIT